MTFLGHGRATLVTALWRLGISVLLSQAIFATAFGQTPTQSGANSTNQIQSAATPQLFQQAQHHGPTFVWATNVTYDQNARYQKDTDFQVRPDLTLQVTRHYVFWMAPKEDDFWDQTKKIPDGWYLMRMLVLLPNVRVPARLGYGLSSEFMTPKERYVSDFRILVRYSGGMIKTDVDLVFPDPTALWTETKLYIQLQPVKQESLQLRPDGFVNIYNTKVTVDESVKPLMTVVNFIPFRPKDMMSESTPVGPNDTDITDIDTYLQETRPEAVLPRPIMNESAYAKALGFKLIDRDSNVLENAFNRSPSLLSSARYNPHGLDLFFRNYLSTIQPMPDKLDWSLTRALCLTIYPPQLVSACQDYPFSWMHFSKLIFTKAIHGQQADGIQLAPGFYNVIDNFSANISHSIDNYVGLSFNPRMFIPLNVLGGALSKVPFDFSWSLSADSSYSVTTNGIAQGTSQIVVTPWQVRIPVTHYRTCIAVTANNGGRWPSWPSDRWPVNVPGLLLCDRDRYNLVATEEYFYASQNVNNMYDISMQAVNMLLRGRRDLNVFLSMIQAFAKPEQGDQFESIFTFSRARKLFRTAPEPLPGVLVYPLVKQHALQMMATPTKPTAPGLMDNLGRVWTSIAQ